MRRCVWSRNLKNEEAMVRVGPQRRRGGGETSINSVYAWQNNRRWANNGLVRMFKNVAVAFFGMVSWDLSG